MVISLALSSFFINAAWAQASRRVIRDLEIQPSAQVGQTSLSVAPSNAAPAPQPTNLNTMDGVLRPISASASSAAANYVPASTGITGPTAVTDTSPAMNPQMIQGLMGMVGALMGGNGSKTNSNQKKNNEDNTNTSSIGTGNSSDNSSDEDVSNWKDTFDYSNPKNIRGDKVDPNRPLPADTQVDGRDCSSTTKTWQPFTKHPFRITSCFGWRVSTASNHNGIDAVILNKPAHINPVAPGKIVRAGEFRGYGCEIVIEHESCPSGIGGTKCYSQYAHLQRDNNGKCPATGRLGQPVSPCTELGLMGNTGASDGAHLHFEVRTSISPSSGKNPVTQFAEWRAHKNYKPQASRCGSVGDGRAPAHKGHEHSSSIRNPVDVTTTKGRK